MLTLCFVDVGFAISLLLSLITRAPALSTENDGWPRRGGLI
jgi:hypothetical protein